MGPASRYAMVGVFIAKFDDNVRCAEPEQEKMECFAAKKLNLPYLLTLVLRLLTKFLYLQRA